MRDNFSNYHPVVNFMYFLLVLLCAMFLMHPVSLGISLCCGLFYRRHLCGWKGMCYMLPLALLAVVINPLFNHQGGTILTYFPNGNPLTLESIIYGVAASVMLFSVICWFSCYSQVMTSDKFIYLFGKTIPSLSLVLSMILRFIPKFKEQFRIVLEGQRSLGRPQGSGSMLSRVKQSAMILSIMTTWALENAIETADSMRSRGYGLPNRTAFSIYQFSQRDQIALLWIAFCGCYLGAGVAVGGLTVRYFPTVKVVSLSAPTISFHVVYLALCLTPMILSIREDLLWKKRIAE